MTGRNKKPGRKHKPYRASTGEYINGLRKHKDGRWVNVDTGETFVEPDERLAILRIRRWQEQHKKRKVALCADSIQAVNLKKQPDGKYRMGVELVSTWGWVDETEIWDWLREQLIERPEYVAQQTGISEIARLGDLPKPQPSPTLKQLIKLYRERNPGQQKQRRQAELFWSDFVSWMAAKGVTTIRQLTSALVAEYGDHERALAQDKLDAGQSGGSPTYLGHRFSYIRAVVSFGLKRGLHAADMRHGLDCCAVLQAPKRHKRLAPHPISREDFHRLMEATDDPRKRAMFITMLNLCMYPSEALALDWNEINLQQKTVVTDRHKTRIIRIGVLWDETVEALQALRPAVARVSGSHEPDNSPVFLSREGNRWSVKALTNQFRFLRKQAGISDTVKCEDLRDGAYTAAIEAGVELTQANLLAGHATGIPDHYVLRKPSMVADAINGIYQAYFG